RAAAWTVGSGSVVELRGRSMTRFAVATLWHERVRFMPAVLAVAFSAVLIVLQTGLLLGTFAVVSLPVDHARADIWIGSPDLVSVEGAQPIPRRWASRLNV